MTLNDLQMATAQFAERHGWTGQSPERRVLYLMTEVGELTREVLDLTRARNEAEAEVVRTRLGLEMYDVLWNVAELANRLGIDLEAACEAKARINETRTWTQPEL